jgi:hypothetical protein
MKKALEALQNAEASINARITELQQEVDQKKAEHSEAAAQYKQMMVDDSAGTKTYSTTDMNKVKMRADELASEITVANERLQMVSAGKQDKLRALIDDVRKGWEVETAKLSEQIEGTFAAARELRAKLTLEVLEGHELYEQARQLRQTLNQAERMVGMDSSEQTKRLGVPENPPTSDLHKIGSIVPTEDEIVRAYQQGKLPEWIRHYADSGEVTTKDELRSRALAAEAEAAAKQEQAAAQGSKGFIGRMLGGK